MQAYQPLSHAARQLQPNPYAAATHSQHGSPSQPVAAPHSPYKSVTTSSQQLNAVTSSPLPAAQPPSRPVFRPKPLSALLHNAAPATQQQEQLGQSSERKYAELATAALPSLPTQPVTFSAAASPQHITSQPAAAFQSHAALGSHYVQPLASSAHPAGFASYQQADNAHELNGYFDQQQSPTSPDFFATLSNQSPHNNESLTQQHTLINGADPYADVADQQYAAVSLQQQDALPTANVNGYVASLQHDHNNVTQYAQLGNQQTGHQQYEQHRPYHDGIDANAATRHHDAEFQPAPAGDGTYGHRQHTYNDQHHDRYGSAASYHTPPVPLQQETVAASYIEDVPATAQQSHTPSNDLRQADASQPTQQAVASELQRAQEVQQKAIVDELPEDDFVEVAAPVDIPRETPQQPTDVPSISTNSLFSRIRSTITSNAPTLAGSFTRGVSALSNQYASVANQHATPSKDKHYSATITEAKRRRLLKKAKQARRQYQQRLAVEAKTTRSSADGPTAQPAQDYTAVYQAETDLTALLSHDRDLKRQLDAKCDELAALEVTLTQLELTLQHHEINAPAASMLTKHSGQHYGDASDTRLAAIASAAEMQAELYRRTAEHLTNQLHTLNERLSAVYDDNNALALIADRRSHRIKTIGEEQQLLIQSLQQQLDDTFKRSARRERELREEREELTAGLKQMVDTLANENQVLKDELRGHQKASHRHTNGAHHTLPDNGHHHEDHPPVVDDIDYSIYPASTTQLADTPTHAQNSFHSSTDQFPLEDYETGR